MNRSQPFKSLFFVCAGGTAAGINFLLLHYGSRNDTSLGGFDLWFAGVLIGVPATILLYGFGIVCRRSKEEPVFQTGSLLARAYLPLLLLWGPVLLVLAGLNQIHEAWFLLFISALSFPLAGFLSVFLQKVRDGRFITGAGIVLFSSVFALISLSMYGHLAWGYADSGIYAETLSNTLHGRFLHTNTWPYGNYFGDHFSPALLFFLPVYAILPEHQTLIVLHSVIIGCGAIPVFLIGRRATGSRGCAVALALGYLLSAPIQMQTTLQTYGFKVVSLAIPLLLAAVYCGLAGRKRDFLIFCTLALVTQESVAPVVAPLGIWFALEGHRKTGAAVALGSLLYFLVIYSIAMPWLRQGMPHLAGSFYGQMGNSISEILAYMVKHPLYVAGRVFRYPAASLVLHLSLPFFFLPLLRPGLLLIGAPTFLFLCLSYQDIFLSYQYQYKTNLVAVFYLAGAAALANPPEWLWRRLGKLFPHGEISVPSCLCSLGLASGILSCFFFGNLPFSWAFTMPNADRPGLPEAVRRAEAPVPKDARILCMDRLASHFTDRRELWRFMALDRAEFDYAIFDLLSDWPPGKDEYSLIRTFAKQGRFKPIFAEKGLVLFQRNGKTPSELKAYGPAADARSLFHKAPLSDLGTLTYGKPQMVRGQTILPVVWVCEVKSPRDFLLEVTVEAATFLYVQRFPPCHGIYPTSLWKKGARYRDRLELDVAPHGEFKLRFRLLPTGS